MIFRYVTHDRVPDYLALGWMVIADLGNPHGFYSVLMQWPCEQCDYIEPTEH